MNHLPAIGDPGSLIRRFQEEPQLGVDLLDAAVVAEKCLIDLAPYPPEVSVGVVAIVESLHAAIAAVRREP